MECRDACSHAVLTVHNVLPVRNVAALLQYGDRRLGDAAGPPVVPPV